MIYAYLHKQCVLSGSVLHDVALQSSYSLTVDARWLLQQLRRYPAIDECARQVADAKHISVSTAKGSILELLSKLSQFGGVEIRPDQSFRFVERVRFRVWWQRRHDATLTGFLCAIVRAYGVMVLPVLLVGAYGLVYGDATAGLLSLLAVTLGLITVSYVVHELGHSIAARMQGLRTILLSRVGYMAVAYAAQHRKTTLITSVSGPLASALCCALGGWVWDGYISVLCWGLGVVHISSLLPWFADGKAIWSPEDKRNRYAKGY